jgi:hypothetical protein
MVVEQTLTLNTTNVDVDWYDPETGAVVALPEYDSGKSGGYSLSPSIERVIVKKEANGTARFPHEVYEPLVDGAISYPPDNPADWLFMGATNPHRLFDGRNNSRTIADAGKNITVSVTPEGRVKFLYFIGLRNVRRIQISVFYNIGAESYTKVFDTDLMISYTPTGWWSWLYDIRSVDRAYRRSAGFYIARQANLDAGEGESIIAPPLQPQITATLFSASDGPAECGQIICGTGFWLGDTEWGVEPEIKDYSTYEANAFGSRSFVKRQTTRNIRGTLWVPTNDYDRIYQLFESRMNSLALYDFNNGDDLSASEVKDALRVYGKLTSASGGLAYNKTPINLQIEGND